MVAGSETGYLMHILRDDPDLNSIYLPISSNRLLLGCRQDVPIASVSDLNRASAQISREFFISADKRDLHAELQSKIGLQAVLLPEGEITDIMKRTFGDLNKRAQRDEENHSL